MMNISTDGVAYIFIKRIEKITVDVIVTDTESYDEKVFDHYIFSSCGQTG